MFIDINGKRINIDTPYTDNLGTTYPNLRTPQLRAQFSITEVPDPERKNEKFYYVQEISDSPYVINTPKSDNSIRSMLWEDIKTYRDTLSSLGGYRVEVETGVFKWFHSDIKSRTQQLGLVLLGANIPVGLKWKTMDGSFVDMTPTLAQQIFMSAAAQDTAIFAVAEQHKVALESITGADNLSLYDWKQGWPEHYVSV